jgi:hypothetical protein
VALLYLFQETTTMADESENTIISFLLHILT